MSDTELPLLLLHGFTGSTASWAPHVPTFAEWRQTIAIDLLGHGETDAPDDASRYRMERCVEDLIEVLDRRDIARTHVLGYSMGGRVALHLAAAHPDRIGALILESASPGIEKAEERKARRRRDDELADFIEREGVERFVERWERLPLFASQAQLPEEVQATLRRQRLHNRPLGLANSLRGMGTGVQPSLHHRLGSLAIPTLLIVGALDEKFVEIAKRIKKQLPRSHVAIVRNAGHAVHLERPSEFERLVLGFLDSMKGPIAT